MPAGLPSTLLERRPDIRQAEQELIAANAQIGAAKAEFFPAHQPHGFSRRAEPALSTSLHRPARLWASAGLGAAAPIFNAGRTRANVRSPRPSSARCVVRYQRAIYTAFRDVSDALVAYRKTSGAAGRAAAAGGGARRASRLSRQRYEGGVDSYLPVLDAQRNLFQGELDLARLRQRELASIVQLYRALGGGWNRHEAIVAGAHHVRHTSQNSAARVRRRRAPSAANSSRTLKGRPAADVGTGQTRRKGGTMAKRMILMLALMAVVLAGLGAVKDQAIPDRRAQAAAMQPPPEAVTTIVAAGAVARHPDRDRHDGGGPGRDGQRRPPRHRRADLVRLRPRGSPATCWSSSTRGRNRRSSPPPRRSSSWRA